MDTLEKAQEKTHCNHPQVKLTRRIYSNDTVHYVEQCQRCGSAVRSVKKSSIDNRAAVPIFDEEKQQQWQRHTKEVWKEYTADNVQKRAEESNEWWAQYNEYLVSSEWLEKRRRVLERDNYICQACLVRKATEVHHLTYAHTFDEPLFDLVSVCRICHRRLHKE